jgi:hypothetical protein
MFELECMKMKYIDGKLMRTKADDENISEMQSDVKQNNKNHKKKC